MRQFALPFIEVFLRESLHIFDGPQHKDNLHRIVEQLVGAVLKRPAGSTDDPAQVAADLAAAARADPAFTLGQLSDLAVQGPGELRDAVLLTVDALYETSPQLVRALHCAWD